MEFISRAFGAFLTYFFDDLPFPLDEPSPQDQTPVLAQSPVLAQMEESVFFTLHFERRWNPPTTWVRTSRRRLRFDPEEVELAPEVEAPVMVAGPNIVGPELPLQRYLRSCKAEALKPGPQETKRMGLRV